MTQKAFAGSEKKTPLTGLVLSGGGARGAYEAGVIQYLRNELPAEVQKRSISTLFRGPPLGPSTLVLAAATCAPGAGKPYTFEASH